MTIVHIEAQVPADELVKAVRQLDQSELEQFVAEVLALHAQRRARSFLPQDEAELLAKINQGIPLEIQKQYEDLLAKRRSETLETSEYNELLALTRKVESFETQRVQYLAELAQLRGVTLSALIHALGIREGTYA
jgi:hypothetical protein